jgi:hypothetical protein
VDLVIFDGDRAGTFADGCGWAQTGTIGVAVTPHTTDRPASRRPGVMFVDAPVPNSKGPAQQEQPLILNWQVRFGEDQVRFGEDEGRRGAGKGRHVAWMRGDHDAANGSRGAAGGFCPVRGDR